ncbi:DsbA family oxidoreductase [Robertkochia solimangrovi]|uniref:DsbA family oxidoreductase n=1 Tax=Robertkochia solimangrovi TaxID=2213046 RepID=UPI00117DE88B|nr:DsbA family oxidoreductase [Robertkochia solimangrovi]TRZ41298.1 DsbA family oxidoreductase [Robertkochia solimangrovi]
MKIEIWSDVVCPWCYIGKRRFEKALDTFEDKDKVTVIWKSFQLDPNTKTDPETFTLGHLAQKYGVTEQEAKQMMDNVSSAAAEEGLDYNLDKTTVTNTFRAHQLIHFAAAHGKQEEAKEKLLHAYFIETKNLDDTSTLLEIGREIGLDPQKLVDALTSEKYSHEVRNDQLTAGKLGIKSVPFFVFDRKYGVSGAQSPEVFLQSLQTSFKEWEDQHKQTLSVIEGESCSPDGDCC